MAWMPWCSKCLEGCECHWCSRCADTCGFQLDPCGSQLENLENQQTHIFVTFCNCLVICMVICWTSFALKLRRFILFRFGLITFRIHLPKDIIFMIFGSSGRDHDSQNQLFLTLDPPNYFNKYKKNTKSCSCCVGGGEITDLGNRKCRKDACREILHIRLISS